MNGLGQGEDGYPRWLPLKCEEEHDLGKDLEKDIGKEKCLKNDLLEVEWSM